ncbi:MAG: hypothetical protein LBT66_00840 [Methanobrevibacter sp.]|jgi:hypothetical protein|nr:hypothetical protein [Candidatus Methanovirga meridionalis]
MIKKENFLMIKKIILLLLSTFILISIINVNSSSIDLSSSVSESYNPNYNILLITISLLIFYLISYILYDNKNISRNTYKRIWTLVLLFSFLFTGISGILLSTLSDFSINNFFNFNLIFWHVECGIVFAITIIFHINIHLKTIIKFLKL